MMQPSGPLGDPERLRTLRNTRLMDSAPDATFQRLVHLAARMLRAPVALVSLVDEHRQFFKSSVGLPEPWNSERGTPLTHSFCQHVVRDNGPLIINDAANHPLVKDNLAVTELGVAAYAGIPIKTASGHTLGSFCVIDVQPRNWTPEEIEMLKELAQFCVTEIALREQYAGQEEQAHRTRNWVARMPIGALIVDAAMRITAWNPAAEKIFGHSAAQAVGQRPQELLFRPEARAEAEQQLVNMAVLGTPLHWKARCQDSRGNPVNITWTVSSLVEPGGDIEGYIAMFEADPPPA